MRNTDRQQNSQVKADGVKMKCHRNVCFATLISKLKSDELYKWCWTETSVERTKRRKLSKWKEYELIEWLEKTYRSEVKSSRPREREKNKK